MGVPVPGVVGPVGQCAGVWAEVRGVDVPEPREKQREQSQQSARRRLKGSVLRLTIPILHRPYHDECVSRIERMLGLTAGQWAGCCQSVGAHISNDRMLHSRRLAAERFANSGQRSSSDPCIGSFPLQMHGYRIQFTSWTVDRGECHAHSFLSTLWPVFICVA